jgi:hypothetical protein
MFLSSLCLRPETKLIVVFRLYRVDYIEAVKRSLRPTLKQVVVSQKQ